MKQGKKANRLINEKSPYLLQHAFNPVQWYPWGDEAFERARADNKPIFLSIGYSTCHWCHVMEHESFENDTIAAIMNERFISIKVDREERPDVDKVYMTALQAMGQNGGWPMSMFLTSELKPFYGGTYFPPENRYGRIGFAELLKRIRTLWESDRGKIDESAENMTKVLQMIPAPSSSSVALSTECLDTCFQQFSNTYDEQFAGFSSSGGFGGGPKFPRPVVFDFLLRYHHRTGNARAREMTVHTLGKMAMGGMYDHIGGGFHRYSVDGEWRVPHFEKMLYDQAQLVNAYVEAYRLTKSEPFASVIRDVLEYVGRDMTHPDGGFFSAEDADSAKPESLEEKGEGAFYIWSKKEIMDTLGNDAGEVFCYYYGVEEGGNALSDPQHEFTGKNILYVARTLAQTAQKFDRSVDDIEALLARSRGALFAVRARRPRPGLDDKVLTSWNGLMISAFARAYQVLVEPSYLERAERAADFVLKHLFDAKKKTLRRRYRDGEARFEAQLDDYAFFVQGLIDLYESSLDARWLESAIELTQTQIDLFWDREGAAFYDTTGKDQSILVRMKEQYDGAEPTGNSIAAMNLLRLAEMTDNHNWRKKAELTFACFQEVMLRQPAVMPQMMAAYDFSLGKVKQIIIAGNRGSEDTQALLREVYSRYLPSKILLFLDGGEAQKRLAKMLPFVANMTKVGGKATAYVCEGYVCQLPTTDPRVLAERLVKKE